MDEEDIEALAQDLQVNLVRNPSKKLGINFKLRVKRVVDFQFLVDRMQSKLQGWKAKLLSQAGRTSFILSTLQSMPLYTFSFFKVPETVCNKMGALSKDFLWGHDPIERKCIWSVGKRFTILKGMEA